MSVTRIRYKKTSEPNVVESVKKFLNETNGAKLKVRLNLQTKEYFVLDDNVDTIEASGIAKDLHALKIAAKDALTQLGIVFADKETRGKRTSKAIIGEVGGVNESL